MPHINRLEHHSQEAQDILSRIPGWIVRWGITLIFVIFLGIFLGCHLIRYPETVVAPVIITTFNPPADLIARTTGRISGIFVSDGDYVTENTIIALLFNTADYEAVCSIYDSLMGQQYEDSHTIINASWLDREYNLGELQSTYNEYRRTCLDYRHYIRLDYPGERQKILRDQIAKNMEYYNRQAAMRGSIEMELFYERRNFERDSSLYANGVISTVEYEAAIRSLIQRQSAIESFEASLTSLELGALQMEQQFVELSMQKENELANYERTLSNARQQLVSQIEQWRYQYLISSPIEGEVTFTRYWSVNQTVNAGERIASVIPEESMETIGRMVIPFWGVGKVEAGQTVNIKLNGYPYMEYGMLKGTVSNISRVPESEGYIAEVRLTNDLTTTYGKHINLIQQMDGTGEILTRDMSLLERFLQPIRALFDR